MAGLAGDLDDRRPLGDPRRPVAGELEAASVDYEAVARGTTSVPERNYLAMKATRPGDRI